jgi:tripartite-type tricarboxylate transporter receptor subunit TctC
MRKHILAVVILTVGCVVDAIAQGYPSRPITINVAFPAGGPSDTVARILSEPMRVSLGQPVVIENVSGAGGTIGVGRVAHAAPDGYMLTLGGWNTHVVAGAIYTLSFDVLRDFEPILLIASNPYLVVARKAIPANELRDLISWLKANPEKATAGMCIGCPQHVFAAFFQDVTGTRFQLVPYRGAAPAIQDLVAGQIDIMLDSPVSSLQHINAGAIKAYAVTAKNRLASAPKIPTVDEAGLPGFYASQWFALWAPKNTPRPVIDKLNAAVMHALADPDVQRRMADLGLQIFPREQQTPEALAIFHRAEIEKWWPIIKAANIKGG